MSSKSWKFAYILPIHKKDKLIERAIMSLDGFTDTILYIVCTEEIHEWIVNKIEVPEGVTHLFFVAEDGEDSYQELVNLAAPAVADTVQYVSVLEYDDKVSPNAHEALEQYFEATPDTEIFFPLAALVVDTEDKDETLQMISMMNDAPFASGVFEEYGVLDISTMLKSNFAFVNGAYFRKGVIEKYGGFKKNIEMFEDWEFVLRALQAGCIMTSIPKIARYHFYNEAGEFERRKNVPAEEREKWLLTVRQEYFFDEDREIS